jgi:hypothetical protein
MILLLILCAAAPVFSAEGSNAQPSQYTLGDQTLSINVGLFVPLFLLPMQPPYTATALLAGSPPQLSLGAVGSLCWAAYVAPQVRLGVELAGNFTLSPNANTLLMLPIMGKASYVFTFYPFEIPLSFAAGMNVVKYIDQYTIDLLLRPGASFYWIYNSSWSFGLNLNYWFDMQFDTTDSTQSRIGNFLEISLSALYHY